MPKTPFADVLSFVRTVAAIQHCRDRSDAELLSSFLTSKEEAAFSVLVQRHGPMVLAVCQRILRDAHLAEDAFQATFLVLARRAASIRKTGSLTAWLHGVARRVASRAKTQRITAALRDQADRGITMTQKAPLDELSLDELRAALDDEIAALPEKYRLPILLCCLQGRTHDEASRELGCPKRTLTSRLARAREMLEQRLAGRGIKVPPGSLALALPETSLSATISALLTFNTVKAATAFVVGRAIPGGVISSSAILLAEGALKTTIGLQTKLILMVATLGIAAGVVLAGNGAFRADHWPQDVRPGVAQAKNDSQQKGDTDTDVSKAQITGMVVDEAGKSIQGALVSVIGFKSSTQRPPAKSAADGSFLLVLDDASAAGCVLTASVENGARQGICEIQSKALSQKVQTQIVVKPSRKMTVRVTDSAKKPVTGAAVGLFDDATLVLAGETAADGAVSLQFPRDAAISQVVALKPKAGFAYFENYKSTRPTILGELPTEVSLTLEGAQTVSVQAVDSEGKALAGVDLMPWTLQQNGKLGYVNFAGATTLKHVKERTNAAGIAVFEWMPPNLDTREVSFVHPSDQFSALNEPHSDPKSPGKPIVAQLVRNAPVSGVVKLPDGKSAPGILIQVEGRDNDKKQSFRRLVRTKADGSYSLLVYPDLWYLIGVTDDDWAAPSIGTGRVGNSTPPKSHDLTLAKGTVLRGLVTQGADKKPAVNKSISLSDFSNEWAGGAEIFRSTSTDSDGRYSIRIGPGQYKIRMPGQTKWEEFSVKAEETIDKNFHVDVKGIESRRPIKGIVVSEGPQAKPVSGIAVVGHGSTRSNAITNDLGQFQVERGSGAGFLHARNSDRTLAGIVAIGEKDDEVKIVLSPVRKIQGRIFDLAGKPLAGIEVHLTLPLENGSVGWSEWTTQTDKAGRYSIAGIPSGVEFDVSAAYGYKGYKRIQTLAPHTVLLIDLGDFNVVAPKADPKQDLTKPLKGKYSISGLPPKEQMAVLTKQARDFEKKFWDDLRATPKDKQKGPIFNDDYEKSRHAFYDKIEVLVRQLGTDPAAFDGILTLVCDLGAPLRDDVARLVVQHHIKNPQMGQLCYELRSRVRESWATNILKAALDQHPDNAVRGLALFAIGYHHRLRADNRTGKLTEAEVTKELDEAARHFTDVVKTYADVLTPDGKSKLGSLATSELTRLKNLPFLKVGKTAPEIVGEDLDGKPLKLSNFRGKVVMLVFWGTWCGPCMREIPHEQALAKQYADKPFVIIGVNSDEDRKATQKICVEKEITWRSFWDGGRTRGDIATAYDIQAWPTIYLLDQDGVIRYFNVHDRELDEAVAKLVADAK